LRCAASPCAYAKQQREKKLRAGVNPGTRGRDSAALDAAGGAMGSIALLTFAFLVWKFLPHGPAWLALSAGSIAWLVVSVSIWRLCEYL
jgi:hypothetical protein